MTMFSTGSVRSTDKNALAVIKATERGRPAHPSRLTTRTPSADVQPVTLQSSTSPPESPTMNSVRRVN